MDSQNLTIAALVVLALVVLAIGVAVSRKRARERSALLRERFGPEYEHALAEHGNRARAERELYLRQRRVDKLELRPLSPAACEQYGRSWATVQQRFVDDPTGAVVDADRLVKEVMSARGYPMSDFEQRVADLSVEHANVIHHYRAARTIAKNSAEGRASTEDLRQAMVHYRALFQDLLQAQQAEHVAELREARV